MNKKFTLLFAAFSFWCISSFAQLSGTYTIGGTTPDYATIQAAITALGAGVSGPVVFDIRPGTYSGKLSMGNVVGTSSTNTITFQSENGDSSSVIITDSSSTLASSNFTILINGTDYLRFNQVTIERSGTNSYSTCVYIGSGSKRISFTNCQILAEPQTFANVNACAIYLPLGGSLDSLVNFSNNLIQGNSYGLYLIGQSPATNLALTQITGNEFLNQGYSAIYMNNGSVPNIFGNTISTNSTNTVYTGIYLSNVSGQTLIASNKISGISVGGDGIYLSNCTTTVGLEGVVKNNFIEAHGTGTARGIELSTASFFDIYNNTISITTNGTGSSCFLASGSGSASINLLNNIFVNTGGGSAIVNTTSPATSIAISDYNDLYTPNSLSIGTWDVTTATDLADWQTVSGLDAASVAGDPQFISSTNLHSGSTTVNDLGTPILEVTDDIDGEARSLTTPDIGADEFTPLSDNIGLVALLSPTEGCGDSATVVGVVIRNFGVNDETGFDVIADVSGMQTATLTETVSQNMSTNQLDTVYFATTINTYAGGTLNISVYTSLSGDQDNTNDTITVSLDFLDHPNAPTVVSPTTQCDNNVQLTAAHDSGDVLMWYDQAVDGNLLAIADTFHTAVTGDTTFYVETHHGSGTTGCLRITEIETNGIPGDYIEIQNLSGVGFDATGYKVVASESYTDINIVNANTWDLGYFNPHEIQYRTDDASDNYWGSNLFWNPASNGWAMIIDPNGAIVDMVIFDWDSLSIQSFNISVGSFTNIVPGTEWVGAGISTSCPSTGISNNRMGSEDHNMASDWDCETGTKGTQNTSLDDIFMNCGVGACASPRVEVQVTVIPGITASLGADTAMATPFSLQLSPGQGYTTYLWSTGETTDTITVTAVGTYWVTVSGANGCTYTDSINVTLIDAVHSILNEDAISFYPNPASTKLTISAYNVDLQKASFRFFDTRGQEIKYISMNKENKGSFTVDLSSFPAGMYFVQVLSNEGTITKRFNVVK